MRRSSADDVPVRTAPPTAGTGRGRARSGRGRPRLETRARSRALQALYAWDIRCVAADGPVDLLRIAEEVWTDLAVPPDERRVAFDLVTAVAERAGPLDRELTEATTNWRLERLGAIERSVLRLGAAELARAETPPRVVIQEAVRLAERYGSVASAKFVNGVLDAVGRRTGRL